MPKAIALLSGGLDSTLAVLTMLRQGVDITAVTFLTHFGCDISDSSSCSKDPFPAAEKFGFEVKLCHLADKFTDIVKNPKYGHGKNMNPCIDCRILMLKEAKELMSMIKADFIITGEVIGQRPMSQRRDSFPVIDREAGLAGYVLRPLSAKHMNPTIPEKSGLVNRDMLHGFAGRSRKPQMALAKEFGLTDYPMPAGGCLLTEPNYSFRLKELLQHNPEPSLNDLHLLRVGRHFRFSQTCRAIVGRDETENQKIESLAEKDDFLLTVEGVGSPLTLLSGEDSEEFAVLAAAICARYSDAKHLPEVEVTVMKGRDEVCVMSNELKEHASRITHHGLRIKVPPAESGIIENYRVENRKKKDRKGFKKEYALMDAQ